MNKSSLVFSGIAMILIYSCCLKDECIQEKTKIDMQILSRVDSTNLLESEVFKLQDLRMFDVLAGDTTFFTIENSPFFVNSTFNFDHVNFNISRIFIDYGDFDLDTLDVMFTTTEGRCCGGITILNTVLQNNVSVYNRINNDNFVILLK